MTGRGVAAGVLAVVPAVRVVPSPARRNDPAGRSGGGLPLPLLLGECKGRTAAVVYSAATVDRGGRVCDRALMAALGWVPGTCVDIAVVDRLVVVSQKPSGGWCVGRTGYVRLPARTQHRCGLAAGDRVVLVAEPDAARLVVHLPAVLDEVLVGYQREVLGGRS